MTGIELADELRKFTSGYGDDKKIEEFLDGFCRQHRTHQQSMFGLILAVVERVASEDYRTDGRNQASHDRAKLLISGFRNAYKNELIESDPLFWNDARATDQSKNYRVSQLPMI